MKESLIGCSAGLLLLIFIAVLYSFAGVIGAMIFAYFGIQVHWYVVAGALWLVRFTVGMLK